MRQSLRTNTILAFPTQHLAIILNQQMLMAISILQQLLEQLKLLMEFSLIGQVQNLRQFPDGK